MQLPPLPDTSARHRSIVANPQLAAPWFEIAHQFCATASSMMTVPAADKMRAVRAARMSCPVWQWFGLQYVKPSPIEGGFRGLVIAFHADLNVDSVDVVRARTDL